MTVWSNVPLCVETGIFVVLTFALTCTTTRPQSCNTVSGRAVTWRQTLDIPRCRSNINRHSPNTSEAAPADDDDDDKADGANDWNSVITRLNSHSNNTSNIVGDRNSSSGTRCDGRCQYQSSVPEQWLRQTAEGVLRPGSDLERRARRLLASSVLAANASVWTAGRILQTLTWEAAGQERQFFQFKGCYAAPHQISILSESYGPFSCLHHCRQLGPFTLMALKEFRCLCLNETDLYAWNAASNVSCGFYCPETPYHCGGMDSLHSVYVVPEYVSLQKTANFSTGCFVGKIEYVNQQHLIVINESLCDGHQANSFCVSWNGTSWRMDTIEEVDGQTFQNRSSNCSGNLTSTLPGDYDSFMRSVYQALFDKDRLQLTKPFWLNLRLKTFTWFQTRRNESTGSQVLPNSPSMTSGCWAWGKRWNGDFHLHVLPCETALPYLTCCPDYNISTTGIAPEMSVSSDTLTLTDPDRKRKEAEAIAVGVSGVVVLLIFLAMALTMHLLKKAGKLKVRPSQKAAFNSTDDWDSPENSSRRNSLAARLQASCRTRTSLLTEELHERLKAQDSAAVQDSEKDVNDKSDGRYAVGGAGGAGGELTKPREKSNLQQPSVPNEQENSEDQELAVAAEEDVRRLCEEEEDSLARRRKDRTHVRGQARSQPAASPCSPTPAEVPRARPSSPTEEVYAQPWDTRSLPLHFFHPGLTLFAGSHLDDSPDDLASVNVPVTTSTSLIHESGLDIRAGETALAVQASQAQPNPLPRQRRSQDPVRDARENMVSHPVPLDIAGQGTIVTSAEESGGTTSRTSFKPHPAPRRPSQHAHGGHPPRAQETASCEDKRTVSQPEKAVANRSVGEENELNCSTPISRGKGKTPLHLKLGPSKSENLSAKYDGGKALGNNKRLSLDFGSLPRLGFCPDDYDQPVDSLSPFISPVYAEPESLSDDPVSREFEARFRGFPLPRREESANNAASNEATITEARAQPAERSSERGVREMHCSQQSTELHKTRLNREMDCADKALPGGVLSGLDNIGQRVNTGKAEKADDVQTKDFSQGTHDEDYAVIDETSDMEKAQEPPCHAKVQTCKSLPYAIPRKEFEVDRACKGPVSKSTDDLRNPPRQALHDDDDLEDYAEIDESATVGGRPSSARTSTTLPRNTKPRPTTPNSPEEEGLPPDKTFIRGYTLPHGTFPSGKSKFKLPKRAKTDKARPSKGKKPDEGAATKGDVPWKPPKEESKMGPAEVKTKPLKTERISDSKVPHVLGPQGDLYARPVIKNKEK